MLHPGASYFMISAVWLHALAFFLARENQTGSADSWSTAGRVEDRLVSFLVAGTWNIFWSSNPTRTTANNTEAVRSPRGTELCLWDAIKSFFLSCLLWFLKLSAWSMPWVVWQRDKINMAMATRTWAWEGLRENAYSCNCQSSGGCYWIVLHFWIETREETYVWYLFSF